MIDDMHAKYIDAERDQWLAYAGKKDSGSGYLSESAHTFITRQASIVPGTFLVLKKRQDLMYQTQGMWFGRSPELFSLPAMAWGDMPPEYGSYGIATYAIAQSCVLIARRTYRSIDFTHPAWNARRKVPSNVIDESMFEDVVSWLGSRKTTFNSDWINEPYRRSWFFSEHIEKQFDLIVNDVVEIASCLDDCLIMSECGNLMSMSLLDFIEMKKQND